jgi:hypothetical protein
MAITKINKKNFHPTTLPSNDANDFMPIYSGILNKLMSEVDDLYLTEEECQALIDAIEFANLADAPAYAGETGKVLACNGTEDGLEFIDLPAAPLYTTKTINIGDWNMDTTSTITVAHGLSSTEWKTIKSVNVFIRNDFDLENRILDGYNSSGTGGVGIIDSTNIGLERVTGGIFDSVEFQNTSYNRGYVTIQYTKD